MKNQPNRWPSACVFLAALVAQVAALPALSKAETKKPCQPNLAACPVNGCEKPGTPAGLFNEIKRRKPTGTTATLLTFEDFSDLQERADDLVGQGKKKLKKADRNKLQNLKVATGQVAEGSLVEISGFVVGKPHENRSGESVNCRLKKVPNNDFHISLTADADDTEFESVVGEMIPQDRNPDWTLKKLRFIAKHGVRVLVSGQLFYDNVHKVNDDPINDLGGQPKRFSLWEVHPVTRFLVCAKPANDCRATEVADWTPLESFTPPNP